LVCGNTISALFFVKDEEKNEEIEKEKEQVSHEFVNTLSR